MGHHPQHIAGAVDDAGDGVQRAVGIGFRQHLVAGGGIAEYHLLMRQQILMPFGINKIAAFAMGDRDLERPGRIDPPGEAGAAVFQTQIDRAADKAQRLIAHQGAGQQAGLRQDLEAVANPQHRLAAFGKIHHRLHNHREAGNRTGAQVVAVGKPARQGDKIKARQVASLMPDKLRFMSHQLKGVVHIIIAIGAGKNNHRTFHDVSP